MNYALYVLAFLWAFWAMYVLVMGIYRAHVESVRQWGRQEREKIGL